MPSVWGLTKMSDYNFEKLEIANFKVEEVRQMQIDILKEYGAIIEDDATLAECAQAIGSVVLGSQAFYLCVSVDKTNKTWSGRRGAFGTDGSWIFDDEVSVLQYQYIAPEEGSLYSSDARIRVLSVNCDPRFLDIFWKEDWAKDPEDKKLEIITDPTTGATNEVWVEQPTSATKVRHWFGPVLPPDCFGIQNDLPLTSDEIGGVKVEVPGNEMSCILSQKVTSEDAANLYAVGSYERSEDGKMLFTRKNWQSKDFSFFCWQKGSFRSGDEILSFVAPEGTPENYPVPEWERPAEWGDDKTGCCHRFALFSDGSNSWKPGFSDNGTYYGSDFAGWKGHLYHGFQWYPTGALYDRNYWHLWGCTYNHKTKELKGYFDGKELDTFHIENEYQESIMDIAGCTILVGWAGAEGYHRVGHTFLSETCYTPEQVQYLANSTTLVTRRKALILASDMVYYGTAGEWFEGYLAVEDNFSSEDGGELLFAADDLPEWISSFPTTGTSDGELYFYGEPSAPGRYTFTLTISGRTPDDLTPPEPVSITVTINIQ